MVPQSLTVPADAAGQRLDAYLTARAAAVCSDVPWAGLSRARFQQLIEAQAVLLNGMPCRAALRLKGGERIEVSAPEPEPMGVTPVPMPLDILHEDADIVVLNKAPGIVVHPGAGTREPTLVHGLLAHCGDLSGIGGVARPGIVHRLDRGTSGVMVVAKHDRAHEALSKQFAARQTTKRYTALVLGVPNPPRATLQTLYGRHPTQRAKFTARVTSGKTAVTSYATMATYEGAALLDVLLGTGRTHQIRVHLSEAGHPIVGDPMYGGTHFARIHNEALREAARQLTHQALHARELTLTHPVLGTAMTFTASLPTSWPVTA